MAKKFDVNRGHFDILTEIPDGKNSERGREVVYHFAAEKPTLKYFLPKRRICAYFAKTASGHGLL